MGSTRSTIFTQTNETPSSPVPVRWARGIVCTRVPLPPPSEFMVKSWWLEREGGLSLEAVGAEAGTVVQYLGANEINILFL